jgi:hypothetical protein
MFEAFEVRDVVDATVIAFALRVVDALTHARTGESTEGGPTLVNVYTPEEFVGVLVVNPSNASLTVVPETPEGLDISP